MLTGMLLSYILIALLTKMSSYLSHCHIMGSSYSSVSVETASNRIEDNRGKACVTKQNFQLHLVATLLVPQYRKPTIRDVSALSTSRAITLWIRPKYNECTLEHSNSGKNVSIRFDSILATESIFFRFDSIRQSDKYLPLVQWYSNSKLGVILQYALRICFLSMFYTL